MSEGNCHGFDIMFSIDFDLNKTDNISVLWKENEIQSKTFPCKVMAHRDGVCSLSLLSHNKKAMALLFYLKHKVRFSMNNKSFSTSRLLKMHRYKLRYEGKMVKFGNLIWKEYGKVFKF